MLRPLKVLAWPVVLGIVLASGLGCPMTPPNYLPTFLITPTSLDFGTTKDALKIKVAKSYTQQPLPEFTVGTGGTAWLDVTPKSGNSSGPDDAAEFTVTVDRTKMAAGVNSANLVVSASGVADQKVPVTATALLVASFSASPLLTSIGKKVEFFDESQVAQGEGPIRTWRWSFGDGKFSDSQFPTHKYKKAGTYHVSLTVETDEHVDTAVKQNYITVEAGENPVADFSATPTSPPANVPVTFTDLSDPGDSPIDSWFWTFGDGNVSIQQNPQHTYTAVGKYTVTLTVTNQSGGSDTETKTDYIDIQTVGPVADFDANPKNVTKGQQVQFTDISEPGTSPITAWLWLFGDGGASVLQNPAHIYSAAGAYTVYLSVTTLVGSDAETKTNFITVTP